MEFEIKAKFNELIRLREELEKTRKSLVDMDESADPRSYERLEVKAHDLSVAIGDLEEEVGITAGAFKDKLASALSEAERGAQEAQATLVNLGEACRASKTKMMEMNATVTELGKAYYRAETGGASAQEETGKLKKRYEEAKNELQRLTLEYYANLDAQNAHRLTVIKSQVEVDKLKAAMRDLGETVTQDTGSAADIGGIVEEKLKAAAVGVAKFSAAVAGGAGLKSFIDQCISARSQLQGMQTSLETMVGKNTAQSLFDQLFDIAKRSPLEMTDMVGATQMMISFGIDAQKSVRYLEALSDISMGDASKFNSLTLAFSQMSATGKLMGQDLNQMINQGFNPLEAIAGKTGKSIAQLKEEMSKGLITAKMVQDAFISVTEEGGRFHNMSAAASKTIAGQMSMLQDALTTMYSTIGEKLEPVVLKAYATMTELVSNWENLAPYIIAGAVALGGAKLAIAAEAAARTASTAATKVNTAAKGGNTAATSANSTAHAVNAASLKAGIKAMWQASVAQKTLNTAIAACPYVLAAMAVAAIAGAVYNWATSMTEAEKSQERLNKAMSEADKEADKEASKLMELDATLQKLDKSSSAYAATKSKMVAEARKWNSEAADEIEKNGLTAESYGKVTEAIQTHYRTKAYLRWKDQEEENRQQMIRDRLSALRDNLMENYVKEGADDKEKASRRLEVNKAMAEISKKVYDGTLEEFDGQAKGSKIVGAGSLVGAAAQAVSGVKKFNNKSLSKETNDLLNSTQTLMNQMYGYGEAATDMVSGLATDAREMRAVIDDMSNLSVFGLTQEGLDAEKKRQEEEEEKKRKEAEEKAKKEAAAGKGDDKEAKKRAEEAKRQAEALRKGVADIEARWDKEDFDRQEASLAKRREAIIRSYEDRRKAVEEMEGKIAAAVKSGVIKQEEADKMRTTLGTEKGKVAKNQNEDIIKLYAEELKASAPEALRQAEEFEKQRLKIAQEYAAKRASLDTIIASSDATDEQKRAAAGELDGLAAAEKSDLAKVDLEEFQKSELYTKVFQDLSKFGQTTLTSLKAKMEEFGDSIRANLSPSDAKAFEDAMRQIDERLMSFDPFTAFTESYEARGNALREKAAATERLTKAQKELRSVESALAKERKKAKKDATAITKLTERKAKAEHDVTDATLSVAKAEDKEHEASAKQQKAKEKIVETFKALEENARAVGEVLGDEVGQVFDFIGATVNMVNTAIAGMQAASKAGTSAMKAVETASVILAVIAAVVKLWQMLDGFLDKDKSREAWEKAVAKQAEINKLTDAVNNYRSAVLKAQMEERSWFSSSGLDTMKNSWDAAKDAMEQYNDKAHQQQVEYQNEKGGKSILHRIGNTIAATGGAGFVAGSKYWKDRNKNYEFNTVDAIDNLRFETQSAKKGSFFKKGRDQKTVDLRSWAKETYGADLFGEDGMIDTEMAKNIIENYGDKLVGETKATLEALIEDAEAYNEAMDQIKQGVADMFSPITDNLTDAVWNWLETGEDALKTFKDSAGSTFKSIAQDMIKTMANKLIFSQYSEQVEALGEKYAKGEITEEQLMSQALDITDSTMQNADGAIKTIQEMSKRMDEKAKSMGYDMTGSTEVTASGGGFETMSETTATELSGRFTALYEVGLRQEALLTRAADGLGSGGFLASTSITLANITSSGLNALLVQAEAAAGVTAGISDCLAQSYLALQDLNETAERQDRRLKDIHTELVKVRKVTDTL